MTYQPIGLADAIEGLRRDLMDAVVRSQGSRMQFSVEPIELTVQAVVTKDADARIGWSILGAGAKYERARTQSLTLKLTPLWKTDEGTLTTDFTIASTATPDDTIASHGLDVHTGGTIGPNSRR